MAVPCRTHLPPNTAFRGFGGPQGMFVMEAAIAKAAEAMSIPAEEIQEMNLLRENDRFYYGQQAVDCRMERTWQEASEGFGIAALKERSEVFNAENFEVKKGYAVMPVCFGISFTKIHLNQGNSLVHVYQDGSVGVSTGGIEMGQGMSTNMASIAARTFGIREDRVKVESTNTTRIANMSPSAASATTDLNGNATILAAREILVGMRAVACSDLGLNAEAAEGMEFRDEVLFVDGDATPLTWEALVAKTYYARKRLSSHGFYSTPGLHFDAESGQGHPFAYHTFGTAVFEVTVDCLRGIYTVDCARVVHDLGRPLNEVVDRGQVEGGLAQGLGWMTMEDLQFDEQGRNLSHALSTYKAPDVYFMPDDLEVRFLEKVDNPIGPLGTKAVGEPPLMYGIGVFFALRYAMRQFAPETEFGFHSPMTPERVLLELHKDAPWVNGAGGETPGGAGAAGAKAGNVLVK
jgi:xanthine dehydrogenase large subunit